MARRLPFYVSEDDPPAKQKILQAAMHLFSARGLAETSIRDIARESGYTNPALYKHFASKEELALRLFETSHRRLWSRCSRAMARADGFEAKLEAYVNEWLEAVDEHPEAIAFLSDSARVLWPKASATVRRRTMIGLARTLARDSPRARRPNPDIAAASLQGTLGELTRMIQVGVLKGPAIRWKGELVALFRRLLG